MGAILHQFAHPCMLLRVVTQSQQLPTFLLFCDRCSVVQQCWGHARALHMVNKVLWVVSFPRCTVGPNIVGSCCMHLHTTANIDVTTPKV